MVSPFKDGILNDWEAVDGILDHALKWVPHLKFQHL